ncbi:PREDICTED: uncharacterized protein LOC101819513 [Ficedula albicollis]|uniref:uncharacterized protein LOC101819513 n=1 Tax=Ficedula albicollis TaxID=59894 RepID=UPI0003596799|nr:PREDICTED: uncharacterized protein LOC101819513 [Ficedula albicollis]
MGSSQPKMTGLWQCKKGPFHVFLWEVSSWPQPPGLEPCPGQEGFGDTAAGACETPRRPLLGPGGFSQVQLRDHSGLTQYLCLVKGRFPVPPAGPAPIRNPPVWRIFLLQLRKLSPFTLNPHGMNIWNISSHTRRRKSWELEKLDVGTGTATPRSSRAPEAAAPSREGSGEDGDAPGKRRENPRGAGLFITEPQPWLQERLEKDETGIPRSARLK